MDDKTLQKKLDAICKTVDEIATEAVRRYGNSARVVVDDTGNLHVMVDDSEADCESRQQHIRFSSSKSCELGGVAW